MLLVFYMFDQERHRLIYGQRIVLDTHDATERIPEDFEEDDREELMEKGWDINVVNGMEQCIFSYASTRNDLADSPDSWPDSFKNGNKIPLAVALSLGLEKSARSDDEKKEGSGETRIFYPGYNDII
jgi:hypothetical protein